MSRLMSIFIDIFHVSLMGNMTTWIYIFLESSYRSHIAAVVAKLTGTIEPIVFANVLMYLSAFYS